MEKFRQDEIKRTERGGRCSGPRVAEVWPSVAPEEMAFAMAVFVGAGNCHLGREVAKPESAAWRVLSAELLTGLSPVLVEKSDVKAQLRAGQSSLEEAFFQVWSQYKDDPAQRSMCARVVGFHHLMVRTEGAAAEPWLTPSVDDPASVELDPAVVEALAEVKLSAFGLLPESEFLDDIVRMAGRRVTRDVIAAQ